MKKIFALILLIFLGLTFSFAQTQIKPGVGINLTNISGEGVDASAQIGWQLGGSVAFGEKFYFEPGIFYQSNSVEYFTSSSQPVVDATYSGIRIPVSVGLDVLGNADSILGVRVFGGGSSLIVTGTKGDSVEKDDIKSPQWGVFAGAGIDIAIFYLDVSYQWSVNNLQKDISSIDLGKTNGFFLTAGLRF